MAESPARRASRRRRERGQSLVEFALVLPVFLMIALAAVDFGWALRAYVISTNSAREGARTGITGASATTVTQKTVATSAGLLSASNVTVTGAGGATGTPVTVAVRYNYPYITPLGGVFSFVTGGALPRPLPMSASTTMRIE